MYSPEIASHHFEIVKLFPDGDCWHAQFAIDNVLYPAFLEPKQNVADMREDDFLDYMRAQALSMAEYWSTRGSQWQN